MTFVGIDGCRAGWVVAQSKDRFASIQFDVMEDLKKLFKLSNATTIIAIDIPIGLAPAAPRRCDIEARRFLSFRGSSVFPVPCRCALGAASRHQYREACKLNFAACGRMLSKQAHNILPKIAAVDRLMNPDLQPFIRESHPEVALAIMNGGTAVVPNKKTLEGQRESLRLLRRNGLHVTLNQISHERGRFGASRVAADDLIDALACLTIARKIAAGKAIRFPSGGQEDRDERGLLMEIWG